MAGEWNNETIYHSHRVRPDALERASRLQNGGHRIAKRSLAWPERSEDKSVPA